MKTKLLLLFFLGFFSYSCDNNDVVAQQEEIIEDIVSTEDGDIPPAILAYQTGANSEDIDTYMYAFAEEISILDVSREITGRENVRAWALREVIASGDTFRYRETLESGERYAKAEVNWLSWVVHYHFWWDENDKITRMSLQYAD
ncbi:nuclear transport factor 2 family protein [Flammeovirga sp. EKP202]|uniref:nuclear transport factor 2 family protein n=1 Tax=Flammeovirga sp. EKP202 TaxID=2770592 RepID=UPI00165F5BBA|nr:nuclear transport factor 2 family protein [Flammeovirga sp. EKP202]MBD0404497.1 nuclear transport factor 2 family protein [Flammeovirga sp. EKP202]